MSETLKWYGDYNYFVLSDYPWLSRGGNFEYGAGSGLFNTGRYYGDADVGNTFRVVAVNLA